MEHQEIKNNKYAFIKKSITDVETRQKEIQTEIDLLELKLYKLNFEENLWSEQLYLLNAELERLDD